MITHDALAILRCRPERLPYVVVRLPGSIDLGAEVQIVVVVGVN